MAHDNYVMLISLDLDGMLTERERQDLLQHTRTCAHCAAAWDQLRRMDALLKVQPEIGPMSDFRAKVMGRVNVYETQRRVTPWLMAILGGLALAVVASTVLPVIVVAFELYKPLLAWPVVGLLLSWIAHGLTIGAELIRLGIHELLLWLSRLATDPVALALSIGGLVVASTWIGLLEVLKNEPVPEQVRQQA